MTIKGIETHPEGPAYHEALRDAAVARDRAEDEPCEVGTVGCCINHSRFDSGCETW